MNESSGRVIQWPFSPRLDNGYIRHRLENVLAVFRAIEAGELLAALPDCEVAREQFVTALRLLSLAERELVDLHEALEG